MDFLRLHPFVRTTAHDKTLGTIIGATLGDCIGLYTEFLPGAECRRAYPSARFVLVGPSQTPFRADSHRDKFEPADWTDDTDQSLLLILSYLHNYECSTDVKAPIESSDIALRLHIWTTQGLRCLDRPPLGLGQTIGRVVLDPAYLDDPEAVALKIWLKSNRNAAPNGSLMRTHPVGVVSVGMSLEETFRTAADVGRVTHVDPRCVVSCCLVAGLVRGIIRGEVVCEADVDTLIESAYSWVNGKDELRNPEARRLEEGWEGVVQGGAAGEESLLVLEEYRKHCHAQTLKELELDDSQKMGYVYKCLGSAILTLRLAIRRGSGFGLSTAELFEPLITNLIMEGGDADTNASVAGALLGAWVGYSNLPSHWEKGVRNREWLVRKAEALSLRVGILAPPAGGEVQILVADPDAVLDGGRGMLTKEQLDKREKDFVMMILAKQKKRREAVEREERSLRGTLMGKLFK
jgi:ADP-ribosylglycohydrolase